MFNRIRGLFLRYERRHRSIVAPGFALSPRGAVRTGYVDRIRIDGTRLIVTGWSTGARVLLATSTGRTETRPSIPRQDVADALGLPLEVGFELSLTHGPGPITLVVEGNGADSTQRRMPVRAHRLLRHRIALMGRFAVAVLGAAPAILRAVRHHDPVARDQVKTALGLQAVTQAAPLARGLFDAAPPAPVAHLVPVTILLPVYNAFDLLPEVLDRVVRNTDLPWHLIVIEDCSTDPDLRPWLRDWVAEQDGPGRIELVENADNKGFIGSVNAGLTRAVGIGHHVILLNSDAFVPPGWASRLLRPMLSEPDVASVTPLSNEAEIFTVPVISAPVALAPGEGDALDRAARALGGAPAAVMPTGVGFCMAMNIAYLRKFPQLDPIFGRGYGEEVDWCQKVRALGGRHLAQPTLFVEHRGGQSFGSEAKRRLVLKNNEIIASRYAGYDTEVQGVIADDPLVGPRLALAIAWAGLSGQEVPVYLAHALGGGADTYLGARIAADLADGARAAVVLRVGGVQRWQVELVCAQGRVAGTTDDFALVERLLAPLERRRIVYSCGVGDVDPVSLPTHLLDLKRAPSDRIEVLVHDFFMLSPSYTLLDSDGVYRGPLATLREDPAHSTRRPGGAPVSLADWRAAWAPLLAGADEIVVFSEDSRGQMLATHPDLAPRLVLRPHALTAAVPVIPPPRGGRRVIGVLGNIGYQKGAAVVAAMGRLLEKDGDVSLVLIGNVDPAWMPPASVVVHGDYAIADLPRLVARYGVTDWLIPSVWPETFSYTTHECLATGLPVYAFGIGAQGAAVAAAPNGHVIAFDPTGDLAQAVIAHLSATGGS